MIPARIEDVVQWYQLEGIDYLGYNVLHINEDNSRAEVLFKLEPENKIILHRHGSLNKSLVISGEHHIYDPDGTQTEVRPTGSYTISPAKEEPHTECGGPDGCIVLFSIFDNDGGALYELMDANQTVFAALTMADLVQLKQAQAA
ncbi:MAG: regulator [Oceanospirillaceae bacterium]|nr:regulator [Oceanospirillaceae bacterium]|tara:strand:- start:1920 stop:2354 length:435 start_codon:yes stop_codon:yes gene_type:complete